ncbi:methylmalonyl-CoA mutase [Sphaerisporangium krabiense]|uniref:Methylmalonyl-CoA mutase C-terminal domain/subunit n=1 Tax=Sphaerisporangium krabiense TaxID=763782 RepID=A0A7W8Z1X8_9ACTN|nr:cobalamin-dependent protein [Sphaerisporangium krabiense]MBB5625880.1 methylmalonyl-CoA mutase C-terminal domain/subunit [Sphaerisporangium krabiense]GII64682.1 methylmalonyl-CoA mutase [Sphaerisporangium krabiense]
MTTTRPIRVVLAKVGLDGHDVGVNLIAKALINGGFEVVYLGKRVPTDDIVAAAVAEDADVIGVSCLSGGLGHFTTALIGKLRASDAADIPVIAGGIDEPGEISRMLDAGAYRYFGPGSSTEDVVAAFATAGQDGRGA